MKGFAILLLSVIFVTLIAGSTESVVADHSLGGQGVFKDENNVNLTLSIDSKYQIYLQVVVRNAQGQLVSVSEAMHGMYIPHKITDIVFDEMPGKKGIVIIDKIEYEKLQYTDTYDVQQISFTKSFLALQTTWTLKFIADTDGHGLRLLPIFQAYVPLSLTEGDILTFNWTILREPI